MKELKVFYGNNTTQLFKYSLKQIAPFLNDLSKENIIIVPDKLSLATEQEIFNALNIDVYYNIAVMGISKFANKIINENTLNTIQCSSLDAKLLVLRAIQNTCDKFKCFSKNYTLGFVDEIYAKIEQIKSSNANINDLIDENASIGTQLKFEDIKLIYNEYEALREGKIDSGELLSLFNQVCDSSEYLKNANVFFVGFDSLTKQGLQVLKNVAKNANYTLISITYAKDQDNARIYDQTFFDSVINLCKEEKIECNPKQIALPFANQDKNLILNNLFSRKKQFEKINNFFEITKTNSVLEEIELCVKQINYLLKTSNAKFSDFAICADSAYFKILTTELEKIGVSVYSDMQSELITLEPIKFLLNVFMFAYNKNPKYLHHILTNEFCGLNREQTQSYITALWAYNSIKLANGVENNNYLDVVEFVNGLSQIKILNFDKVENYLNILSEIIKKYEIIEKINQKCLFFEEKQEIFLNKTYLQIEKKLIACIETIQKTINNISLSFDEFYEILEKILTETSINSVPSCVNQVFIGDLKSFYLNKKYLFVLGMNQGVLPSILSDTGLISDKEIISDTIKAKLEPTTKIINKRNRFKLFENILSPSEKCFMSYHVYGADNKASQPNEFISEFLYLFNNKQNNAQNIKALYDDINFDTLCFNLVDEYNANLILNNNLNIKIYSKIKNALQKNNAVFEMCKKQYAQDFDICKLFFKNNKTSISVIEKYNSCPKSAYLANALRLQPVKRDKVEANIIGSFLHEIGEKFVRKNTNKLGQMTYQEIEQSVNVSFDLCLKDEKYYALTLQNNSFLLKLLKAESLRFCTFLNNEQITSDFKPIYEEKKFGGESDFDPIQIQVDEKTYNISGIIDRIDATENEFRIIDYKTGNTNNASGDKHLYYGTKIQLFVYAYGIKNNLNKKFFGAFYLPIKNGFTKDGQEQYAFSGFFENDSHLAIKCDKNLLDMGKSKIINASLLKVKDDGVLNLKKKSNILSGKELDAYLDYSIQLVKQSVKDIQSGFIDCSPINGKCKFCEYNNICKFAFDEKLQRTEKYNVTSEEIKNLIGGIKND